MRLIIWSSVASLVLPYFFHNIPYSARFSERSFAHKKCVSCFSITLISKISRSKKNWKRYHKKTCILVKYPVSLSDFNDTWIFSVGFRKYSYVQYHENRSSGSRTVSCGRTDRHNEANSRFSQFFEHTHKDFRELRSYERWSRFESSKILYFAC
jgi:hypothetical protein